MTDTLHLIAHVGGCGVMFNTDRVASVVELDRAVPAPGAGPAVIGLAVAEGAMDAEQAWDIGHLDELWQAEQWGKDPLAEAGHRERQADLAAAVDFLRLL